MKDDEQREIVYCLRYVLTQGIALASGHEQPDGCFIYDTDWHTGGGHYHEILKEGEWTRDAEESFLFAESMRQTRIKELQDLSFDLPEPGATLVGRYADDDLEVPNAD